MTKLTGKQESPGQKWLVVHESKFRGQYPQNNLSDSTYVTCLGDFLYAAGVTPFQRRKARLKLRASA